VTTAAAVLSPERQELGLKWTAISRTDPRLPFAAILTVYAILGCTWLGFNRNPIQILLTVSAGCLMDMVFHWLFRGRTLLVPLSAYISSVSIALLLNYSHNYSAGKSSPLDLGGWKALSPLCLHINIT
jgi:hypothetical protein